MHGRLTAKKWQSIITKKTQDERVAICHKLTNDESALAMMCGRDEEPWLSATTCWKIAMACTCYKVMDTWCIVWNKHWKD
jgi:hypothetical protein